MTANIARALRGAMEELGGPWDPPRVQAFLHGRGTTATWYAANRLLALVAEAYPEVVRAEADLTYVLVIGRQP